MPGLVMWSGADMQVRITYEGGGYQLMVSTNGIDERPHGPRWPTPREASRFYDTYLANHPQTVSPLRSSDDGSATPGVAVIPSSSGDPSGDPAGRVRSRVASAKADNPSPSRELGYSRRPDLSAKTTPAGDTSTGRQYGC